MNAIHDITVRVCEKFCRRGQRLKWVADHFLVNNSTSLGYYGKEHNSIEQEFMVGKPLTSALNLRLSEHLTNFSRLHILS
ncbi:hypothetical protein K0M31_001136 [Melipona bicolor]|uniref:Uncharacterized protein n=1 Tax=Melipona bicolor TaxID=60889 RepID=A0AA40GF35_9HYME|nr:hypothetical protein K0M31_001136 [Melipona bicolor]